MHLLHSLWILAAGNNPLKKGWEKMSGTWDFTTHINTKIFTHCFMKKYDMREIEHIVDGKDCLAFYSA